MIIKMLITFDYNPETNEYKALKQEIVKEKESKPVETVEDNGEPSILLTDNKYILNKLATELLEVEPGDRIDIKYQMVDNLTYPIIGSSKAWKSEGGNKITKSLTVSCRGQANSLLSQYGKTFTLSPWIGHPGLFTMLGDEHPVVEQDSNIKVTESPDIEDDIKEVDNQPNEDIFKETDNFDLTDIDFEL